MAHIHAAAIINEAAFISSSVPPSTYERGGVHHGALCLLSTIVSIVVSEAALQCRNVTHSFRHFVSVSWHQVAVECNISEGLYWRLVAE